MDINLPIRAADLAEIKQAYPEVTVPATTFNQGSYVTRMMEKWRERIC
jgi:hypothetical protein